MQFKNPPSKKHKLSTTLATWIALNEERRREFDKFTQRPEAFCEKTDWVLAWTASTHYNANAWASNRRRARELTGRDPWPEDKYIIERRQREFYVRRAPKTIPQPSDQPRDPQKMTN